MEGATAPNHTSLLCQVSRCANIEEECEGGRGAVVPPGGSEGRWAAWCMPHTLQAARQPPATNCQQLPQMVKGGWSDTRITVI